MPQLNALIKRALFLIGTGTATTTAYAAVIGSSVVPTLAMGTGAVIGIAILVACAAAGSKA